MDDRGRFFAIRSLLPEVQAEQLGDRGPAKEYSSSDDLLDDAALLELLTNHRLMIGDADDEGEMLR